MKYPHTRTNIYLFRSEAAPPSGIWFFTRDASSGGGAGGQKSGRRALAITTAFIVIYEHFISRDFLAPSGWMSFPLADYSIRIKRFQKLFLIARRRRLIRFSTTTVENFHNYSCITYTLFAVLNLTMTRISLGDKSINCSSPVPPPIPFNIHLTWNTH